MTSSVFHLVLLLLIGAMSIFSWYGYRAEPAERRTALKWNAVVAVWFTYLFWAGPPAILESNFDRAGLFVLSLSLAINARRTLLGIEFLWVKHYAYEAIISALKSGRSIGVETTMTLGGRSTGFIFPGLRIHFLRRQAEQARALRERVAADALLAEAIVRRERAWEEAQTLKSRRRAAPDSWRDRVVRKPKRQRRRVPRQKIQAVSE
jgi:hypothetical protein